MKQTAVEWLESKFYEFETIYDSLPAGLYKYTQQAKEMEKEQLKSEQIAKEHFRKQRDEGLLEQSKIYSEEDMRDAFEYGIASGIYQVEKGKKGSMDFEQFIEQFKNKQ
jgi:hypothetical protein